MKKALFYLLTLITLSGCATLGTEKPKTFRDHVAYAYATEATIIDTAKTAYSAGKISADVRDKIYIGVQSGDTILKEAVILEKTDLSSAQSKLEAALKVFKELKDKLKQNGVL